MQALNNNKFEQAHDFKNVTTLSEVNRNIFMIKLSMWYIFHPLLHWNQFVEQLHWSLIKVTG